MAAAAKKKATSSAGAAAAADAGEVIAAASSSGADGSAAASSCAAADDGWDTGDLLAGRSCNFVSEKIASLYQKSAKIVAIKGKRAKIRPDHLPHEVEVDIADLDLLPRLMENPQIKKGPMSKADLDEAKLRFQDDFKMLAIGDCLSDRHIMIGHWVIQRDLPCAKGHYLVPPQIVWTFNQSSVEDHEEAAEMRAKAVAVITRRFARSGLLGVPICFAGHWTLLCFRRSALGLHIVYYDSLSKPQADCLKLANAVVELLSPGRCLTEKSNASVQSNAVDCGVYLLHYWEMEMRRLEGYGWQGPWPQNGKEIKNRKERLIKVLDQIRAYLDAPPADPPKKKKKEIAMAPLPLISEDDKSRIIKEADLKLCSLEEIAGKAAHSGSVEFYGCSKCRYIRSGCISFKCNPKKFLAHLEKFPEKYTTYNKEKDLLKEIFVKMPDLELIGGGDQV